MTPPVRTQSRSECEVAEALVAGIVADLRAHNRFLVVSHARPDGDAVGSVLAMGAVLESMGKQVDRVLADAVPAVYRTLPGWDSIRVAKTIDPGDYDLAIILECDGTLRTGIAGMEAMRAINIDHHLTGCGFGTLNWIDPDASAVAAMVYQIAVVAGVTVTPSIATCLYTALLTDTGSFTYPGTSAETFTLAQQLIALGAQADSVARDVLYSVPAARIHLLGIALSRLQIQGAVAWSYITQEDLHEVHATDEDSEGTVNYLISIAGVEAAAFLREMATDSIGGTPEPHERYRISLRSKSDLDVSRVAASCGGGGHRNAAGCTVAGSLEGTVRHVVQQLESEVSRRHAALAKTAPALSLIASGSGN